MRARLQKTCAAATVSTSTTTEAATKASGKKTVDGARVSYEITTFRTESGYADNRHPDSVSFVTDIESDLSRRDFTINAMAYNDADGVVDIFGGRDDINAKLIRAVESLYSQNVYIDAMYLDNNVTGEETEVLMMIHNPSGVMAAFQIKRS